MMQVKLLSTTDEPPTAMLVIEPGNIKRLKEGKPMKVDLRTLLGIEAQVVVVFTPDMPFVVQYLDSRPLDSETLSIALEKAQGRPEVMR